MWSFKLVAFCHRFYLVLQIKSLYVHSSLNVDSKVNFPYQVFEEGFLKKLSVPCDCVLILLFGTIWKRLSLLGFVVLRFKEGLFWLREPYIRKIYPAFCTLVCLVG